MLTLVGSFPCLCSSTVERKLELALEHSLLKTENVVDIFQLALLCNTTAAQPYVSLYDSEELQNCESHWRMESNEGDPPSIGRGTPIIHDLWRKCKEFCFASFNFFEIITIKIINCVRMWQLFELHSHLCADSNVCRVPLCRLPSFFSFRPHLHIFIQFIDLKTSIAQDAHSTVTSVKFRKMIKCLS